MKRSKAYMEALKKAVRDATIAQIDELVMELGTDVLDGGRGGRKPLLDRLLRK